MTIILQKPTGVNAYLGGKVIGIITTQIILLVVISMYWYYTDTYAEDAGRRSAGMFVGMFLSDLTLLAFKGWF
jgi:hypothetical protein